MFLIVDLANLFLIVAVGFYVFVVDPRSRANQTFAAFNLFLAAWAVKDIVLWEFGSELSGLHWWLVSSALCALLMQYALVVFAWVFPENRRTPRKKAAVLFSPGIVFAIAALLGLMWDSESGINLATKLDPSAYVFFGYLGLIFTFGTSTLMLKWRRSAVGETRRQILAVLVGVAVTASLQLGAIVIALVSGTLTPIHYSSLLSLPGVAIFAFAILRFRLFSLKTALDGLGLFPIGYKLAVQIATVAVASFVIIQIPIVIWAFGEYATAYAWKKYIVISVIAALVPNLALALLILRTYSRPLRRIAVTAVKVAGGEYGAQVDTRPTNDEISLLGNTFNAMSRKMADDISRLESLAEQLMRTEKLAAIGRLSAGMTHEINNPLAAIASLLRNILDRGKLDQAVTSELETILGQVERISRISSDMMDFARTHESIKTSVDLNSILIDTIRILSFDSSFRSFTITTELASRLPRVFADPDRIQQVFLNILLNARDAMSEGGKLAVSSKTSGEFVEIEIADDGSGLPKDDETRVFDPFFTTKSDGEGSGLGLAVCYGIITSHGGTITARHNEPHGAVFTIRIPSLIPTSE